MAALAGRVHDGGGEVSPCTITPCGGVDLQVASIWAKVAYFSVVRAAGMCITIAFEKTSVKSTRLLAVYSRCSLLTS